MLTGKILLGLALAGLLQAPQGAPASPARDLRADYDVQAYRIDLAVDPDAQRIDGTVYFDAVARVDGFRRVELDLAAGLELASVRAVSTKEKLEDASPGSLALAFTRRGDRVALDLPEPIAASKPWRIAVTYGGKPARADDFTGFHWSKTPDGKPWIATSCQATGSHAWWPCKDSFWHPEDKPARLLMNVKVPDGLTAVCNGRLDTFTKELHGGPTTYRWVHDYPLETYAVALNVAPYVEVVRELELDGLEAHGGKLAFHYYVIPGHEERAKLQFQDVPKMLAAYSKAFGPYPFPRSKFALVETPFWGMEHSTCVAYGSSFPAWCEATGAKDPHAGRNQFFDYILVHESAHEWWGNAVSAADWGDFWIHEGFATYAEGVYVELAQGVERAEEYFRGQRKTVSANSRLYSGAGKDSGAAYNTQIYPRGAAVLHTLRQYVADDDAWWRALRAFNLEFRYKNARTEDFRAVLERETKQDWKRFFDEWVFGSGYPKLAGTVRVDGAAIVVDASCASTGDREFHVPLDLAWTEAGAPKSQRVWLAPGANALRVERPSAPSGIQVVGLERILGRNELEVAR